MYSCKRAARAADLGYAAGAGADAEAEAVQLDDGRHQAQAKPQPFRAAALVRAIEAPRDGLALHVGNAGPAVLDPHDRLALAANDRKLDAPALGRELHRVVHQVGDRLRS